MYVVSPQGFIMIAPEVWNMQIKATIYAKHDFSSRDMRWKSVCRNMNKMLPSWRIILWWSNHYFVYEETQ